MSSTSDNSALRTLKYALVLVGIIVATLGVIYLTYFEAPPTSTFFARSINDASYDCEDKIKDRFGSSLLSSTFDQYSSRYDADDGQYIIYYRISAQAMDEQNRPAVREHMAKCTVWETLGFVSSFQVFDDF